MEVVPRREWPNLVSLLAAGIFVRSYDASFSFNHDEIFSVELASQTFRGAMAASLRDQPHPPLYNILLYIWVHFFGTSEVTVRALSIILSACFVALSYVLCRRFITQRYATSVSAIVALSPYFVFYTQEARPYTLIALLACLNLILFFRLADRPQELSRIIVWWLCSSLLVYSQYIAVLTIGMECVLLSIWQPRYRGRLFLAGILSLGSIAPWFLATLQLQGALLPQLDWMGKPTYIDVAWYYVSMFGDNSGLPASYLLLLLLPLVIGCTTLFVRTRSIPSELWFLFLLAFALPFLIFALSIWGPRSIFASRQLLGPAVAFMVLVGIGMQSLPPRMGFGVALLLITWTGVGLSREMPHVTQVPWREIAAGVDTLLGSTPLLTTDPYVARSLNHYRTKAGVLFEQDDLPAAAEKLFVACRPFDCAPLDDVRLNGRKILLESWHWGSPGRTANTRQLLLYEIQGTRRSSANR
jgi:mannosyltransferase